MHKAADFLSTFRHILKLYERLFQDVCRRHGLTQNELRILSFLIHHPTRDTAGDIVQLRMLPKGHASQGVDTLMQKGLLQRRQDASDRRRQHLSLTPAAATVVQEIEQCTEQFEASLFAGFSPQERAQYEIWSGRIANNAKTALERKSFS